MDFPASISDLTAPWLASTLGRSTTRASVARIGVGYGTEGVIARVTLDAKGDGPKTLVAKWCAPLAGEKESTFLRDIGPRLPIRVPRFIAFLRGCGNQALLLSEDISPAVQGDALVGLNESQACAAICAAAQLHAAFWDKANDPAFRLLAPWPIAAPEFAARTYASLPVFLARFGETISPRAREIAGTLHDHLPDVHARLRDAPQTLIHGDLHAENMIFTSELAPVLLDWTHAAWAPAAIDLARLFIEGLSIAGRRAYEEKLLALYARELASHGVRGYEIERLRADVALAALVIFGKAIRWGGSNEASAPHIPRLGPLCENLIGNCAAFLSER